MANFVLEKLQENKVILGDEMAVRVNQVLQKRNKDNATSKHLHPPPPSYSRFLLTPFVPEVVKNFDVVLLIYCLLCRILQVNVVILALLRLCNPFFGVLLTQMNSFGKTINLFPVHSHRFITGHFKGNL